MKHYAIVMVPRLVELLSEDAPGIAREMEAWLNAQPKYPSEDSTSGFYQARVLEVRMKDGCVPLAPLPEAA